MDIKAFIYHKRAEKYSDCQDCFRLNTQNNRIAVSDGMSQSIFPQWWAKILVDAFLETGKIPYDNILPYQIQWQNRVRDEIAKQEAEGKNPWLLRDMFAERSGAGATICGFEWDNNGWACQCLGDSCLIKIKEDYTIEIITSQKGNFDNYPDYLDSFTEGRGEPVTVSGDFNLKAILLVTDPFAELFQIHQNDSEFISKRLNEICNLSEHESFISLVENWRNSFNLHNDDSTLIIITDLKQRQVNVAHEDDIEDLSKKYDPIPQKLETPHKITKDTTNKNTSEEQKEIQSIISVLENANDDMTRRTLHSLIKKAKDGLTSLLNKYFK